MTENPSPTPEDLHTILAPEDVAWDVQSAANTAACESDCVGYIHEIQDLRREMHYMRKLVCALERDNKALRQALKRYTG